MPAPANPTPAAVAVGGIDLGGTKIEAIVADPAAAYKVLGSARHRKPSQSYPPPRTRTIFDCVPNVVGR